ncbi:MAG: FKBP-type peptidyl-prolyl cis-trans isomerase [Muribaculaceae bacterium]|nr:FKBP-type peptidyl-prolyl cis-trans isomerase [Muribaculaceae bacterium]
MEEKRETVGPGKFVEYAYKLYNDKDGSLLFETPKDAPDEMVFGVTPGIVPGLMATLEGLGKGDKFEVTLPPVAAFGDPDPEYIMTLDKEIFMRDGKLADEVKVGAVLPMMTADNLRVQGKIMEIGDKIKMDFNHPFAGLTVTYKGEVVEVRDSTPEDLPQGGCCGGCGGGGCEGGCDSGNCGCE